MAEPDPRLDRLRDPLSEPTRSARKSLLVASMVGIVIVKAGLVPTEIAALGIQFEPADQQTMLTILGLIILYFLITFGVYAISDLTALGTARRKTRAENLQNRVRGELSFRFGKTDEELEELAERAREDYFHFLRRATLVSTARAVFEFGLPVLVAVYALTLVW